MHSEIDFTQYGDIRCARCGRLMELEYGTGRIMHKCKIEEGVVHQAIESSKDEVSAWKRMRSGV